MLNCEKFRDKIEELGWDIAIELDGKLTTCGKIKCSECKFNVESAKSCGSNMVKWLMSEYKEQKLVVDWTKVPIDTPVICDGNVKRHFAGFVNGNPVVYRYGQTSWSDEQRKGFCRYETIELAEPHPEWMKEVEN